MRNLAVYIACWLLKQPLTLTQRTTLIGAILANINALPLKDIITTDATGTMVVNGTPIDIETAHNLREGAIAMRENFARRLVYEQVASIAARRGIAEGDTPEKLYFYRAAIWWGLTEQDIYDKLAGKN